MNILTSLSKQGANLFSRDLDSRTPKGLMYLLGGGMTEAGTQVSQSSSLGLSGIYKAVNTISDDFASLPTDIFTYSGQGRETSRDNNQFRLLNFEPNYFQTPYEYNRQMAVNRLMFGNAYAIIDRYDGSGEIRNLIPVHPDKVETITELEGELFYHIYGVDNPISMFDMIHIKDLSIKENHSNSNDNFKGQSRIEVCREAIGSMLALDQFSANFFGNGANIGTTVESELGAIENEEQRRSLENSLNAKYTGPDKAYKSLVLPSGFRLGQGATKFNQQQSQFIETKFQKVEEIAQIFNLPLHKMSVNTDGNSYNSVEQANIEYVTNTLRPFSIAFEQEYNKKIFNAKDRGRVFTKVALEFLKRGDLKSQAEYADLNLKNGTWSVNDSRHYQDMPSIPEGDDHYTQGNQMKLGADAMGQTEPQNEE